MIELDFDKGDGLVPCVVQDFYTREVLMLGFMNNEALQETVKSGFVTFFSRSKGRLWMKGEESGNTLKVVKIQPDCDADTLLIQVIPAGNTCHTGSVSCFKDETGTLINLENTIQNRIKNPQKDSYTTSLIESGVKRIAQKVGEEGVEVALAAVANDKNELINESADLIYHLITLLNASGLSFKDVVEKLHKRSQNFK
jgi:phosphoribosyl-ATP pyrophosphohydrolase/phosphoribosyl-AMP cyclohydrolase